jgi:hypothetical protein
MNRSSSVHEVSSVFTVSLALLSDPKLRTHDDLGFRGKIPRFHGGVEEIWGLTAYVTQRFLDELARLHMQEPVDR